MEPLPAPDHLDRLSEARAPAAAVPRAAACRRQPAFPRSFDLLIVDEAHNVAPSGTGNYARPTRIGPRRSGRSRRTSSTSLFLTATPHNGYSESFTALLELLDDQRFARGVEPDRDQLAAVMVRRLKTEIVDWDGKPRFP